MTREELIEAMARALCLTATDTHTGWEHYKPEAVEVLAAIEAAGVRLVPVDPDGNQLAAGMESDSISHPWQALGVYRMMLSRSPYALKETDQ